MALAPRLFAHAYEYPLVILLALLCIPIPQNARETSLSIYKKGVVPALVLGLLLFNAYLPDNVLGQYIHNNNIMTILSLILVVVCSASRTSLLGGMAILFIFVFMPWFKPLQTLIQQRNFYGIKQVLSKKGTHVLMSQTTVHGFQTNLDEKPTNGAIGYYHAIAPMIQHLQADHQPLHAMILGLGTGIMACQFRPMDKLTMVEIDEQVINIANNPDLFTYLRDCPPQTSLIKDDGLLAVSHTAGASYELLMLDAFNSDAVPIHLLTLEAFSLYKNKITPDGVILVNISNRHLRLLPVLMGTAHTLNMLVLHKLQPANDRVGQFASEWALLTTNQQLAEHLVGKSGWHFAAVPKTQLWTNDYSNLISLLKW